MAVKEEMKGPRVVYSELSRHWYVLTRYRVKRGVDAKTGEPHHYLVASQKYDVTDQMQAILREAEREWRRKRKRKVGSEG